MRHIDSMGSRDRGVQGKLACCTLLAGTTSAVSQRAVLLGAAFLCVEIGTLGWTRTSARSLGNRSSIR